MAQNLNASDSKRFSCTKRFGSYPFAHRQHRHDGHCAFVHGHNWVFEIEFGCSQLDENGFVFDFGKMDCIKNWLKEMFDHTMLVLDDDPQTKFFQQHSGTLFDVRIVKDASSEGLAMFVAQETNKIISKVSNSRVSVKSVTCFEDENNSATYALE